MKDTGDRTKRNIDLEDEKKENSDIISKIKKREGELESVQKNWTEIWRECAKYALPMIEDKIDSITTEGKEHSQLYDSTAQIHAEKLTNTMFNFLTPSASRWFYWTTGDATLDSTKEVSSWLQEVNKVLEKGVQECNFYEKIQEGFLDSTVLGTCLLFTEKSGEKKKPVVFKTCPIYKARIGTDFRGEVDTVYQKYEMKGYEIIEMFPDVKDKLDESDLSKSHTITHAIEPSTHFFGDKKPLGVKKFINYLIIKEKDILLTDITEGYNSFPVGVGMFYKASGDTYGRSPMMRSLANIRSLNLLRKSYLTGTQLASAPPLQAKHNSIIGNRIVFKPFGITHVKGDNEIKPLITGARPDIGEATITKLQEAVGEAFYQDMLSMTRKTHQLQDQIASFNQEQVQALSAVFVRMTSMLEVALNRMFEIYESEGLIPPAPDVLLDKPDIKIQYRSQLARAQRQGDVSKIMQVLNVVGAVGQLDPQSIINIDTKEILKDALEAMDSTTYMRAEKEVKKIQEAQQAEMDRARQMEEENLESQTIANIK